MIMNQIPRPLVRTNQWFLVVSILATWISGEEWLLVLPLTAGILGLLFGFNPVMGLAKLFLVKDPSSYIYEDGDQQRFNQVVAVVCLALALISYLANWKTLAFVFAATVALAALVAILGFCVGCFVRYHWTRYRKRTQV